MDPVKFYKDVLGKAEKKSVTIIAIGFLTHLKELHDSDGGKTLIEEKVAELVVQAGNFHDNVTHHAGFNLGNSSPPLPLIVVYDINVYLRK